MASTSALSIQGLSRALPSLASNVPVLLLPFRLETRFVQGDSGAELWIRVYPDEISINSLKATLAQAEATSGSLFWNQSWNLAQVKGTDPKAPWRTIAGNYGPARAAWIVKQTYPPNWPSPLPSAGMSGLPTPQAASPEMDDQTQTPVPVIGAPPDIWTAFVYSDTSSPPLEYQFPNRVDQNLALAPDLASEISVGAGGVIIPDRMKWMIDFDLAVKAGMAAKISLAGTNIATAGAARIVVLGLRASAPGADQTSILSSLLDSHRFSDGLAFVPQGAPTKNTPSSTSIYRRDDPGFEDSYATEFGDPVASKDSNSGGSVLASALGLPASIFDHVEYADRTEAQDAAAMMTSLWPATMGYYLGNMMGFQPATVEAARQFAKHVFPRGPFPAVRVGTVPYGILPVTSIDLLLQSSRCKADPLLQVLVPMLKNAVGIWAGGLGNVPVVSRTGDPNGSLLRALAMSADPQSYTTRLVMGPQFLDEWLIFSGGQQEDYDTINKSLKANGSALLTQLGFPGANPFILGTAPIDFTFPLSLATVYDGSPATSETDPLPNSFNDPSGKACNYIGWLASADVSSIRDLSSPKQGAPSTLLYVLLRQSVLRLAADLSVQAEANANVMVDGQLVTLASLKEAELVNYPSQLPTQTPWRTLNASVPGVTATGQSYGEFLTSPGANISLVPSGWVELQASLQLLSGSLPTAELDRLLSETLGAMSSRIDSWVTGVAHSLLPAQLQATAHLGGYAWVENLVPNPPTSPISDAAQQAYIRDLARGLSARRGVTIATPTVYSAPPDNAGFIHAPSISQAATAAILRNGFVTHIPSATSNTSAPFSVDLSSHRLRTALDIVDGLRQGNSLTAILGYHFESMMQPYPGLAALIAAFEDAYPLVANKLTQPPGPPSNVAAPNVVDGLALLTDYGNASPKFQQLRGQITSQNDGQNFDAIMAELQDGMSALEDVFTAETVYQIQKGNTVRAGGALASVEQGNMPPEIEVLRTQRSGIAMNHRVAMLVPSRPAGAGTANPGDNNPRTQAEPNLHSWLAGLIPDPKSVACRYSVGPPGSDLSSPSLVEVTLDVLDAGPLDFLAMSLASTTTPQRSELEARILDYIYNESPSPPPSGSDPVVLVYGRDPKNWDSSKLSIPEYLVVLRAFSDLLGGCRPLAPADLASPATGRTVPGLGVSGSDVVQSATDAANSLATAVGSLQNARGQLWNDLQSPGVDPSPHVRQLQTALRAVSWYNQPHAVPVDPIEARRLVPVVTLGAMSMQPQAKTTAMVTFSSKPDDSLAGEKITVWMAPGTVLSHNLSDYSINGTAPAAPPNVSGNAVQLAVPNSFPPSGRVSISIANMTNPSSGGPTASVVTSGGSYASEDDDPLLVALGFVAQADLIKQAFQKTGLPGPATKVTNLAIAASGPSPLGLTLNFTTSTNGKLDAGAGTISIMGPAGAVFSSQRTDYQILRQNPRAPPKVSGSSVEITVPVDISGGSQVTLVVSNLKGPMPASAQFSVATSSDAMPASGSAPVSIPGGRSGGSALQSASVTANPVGGTYTIQIQTSGSGLLRETNGDMVRVWGPGEISFSPHAENYLFFPNVPNPTPVAAPADPQINQAQAGICVPFDINPGDSVTLVMRLVQSPGAGDYGLSIATSSDAQPIVAPFSVPLGADEADATLNSIFGRSFIALPSFIPRNGSELAGGLSASSSLTSNDTDALERWMQQLTHVHSAVRRMDHALGLSQVLLGSSAPTPNFLIGQLPIVPNDQWLAMPIRPSVSPGSVVLDNTKSGNQANYKVTFSTSPSGSLAGGDSIVATAPAGTELPSTLTAYSIVGQATGNVQLESVSLATWGSGTAKNQVNIVLAPGASIPAGDIVTMKAAGVTNPGGATDSYQILIFTTADPQPAATSPYSIVGDIPVGTLPNYSGGRLNLVLLVPKNFDPTTLSSPGASLQGLWVDAWAERVPGSIETTGIAFHYEEPLSQAPQALLLAVNPTDDESWTERGLGVLLKIVEETLALAKVRAVDETARTDGGEFLPAVYCAFNPSGDTVSTDFQIGAYE